MEKSNQIKLGVRVGSDGCEPANGGENNSRYVSCLQPS